MILVFSMRDVQGTGISAKSVFKWFSKSQCRKIVLILDCCYAEKFTEAFYRARGDEGLDKHLYLLASSEMSQPSVSDESWLEYGYMTFFIKHYFNFIWLVSDFFTELMPLVTTIEARIFPILQLNTYLIHQTVGAWYSINSWRGFSLTVERRAGTILATTYI